MEPVDPDELIDFLQEHEPELGAKLEKLRAEKPGDFKRRLPVVSQLYQPVMREMKFDPTMATLNVKRIRLRLEAKEAVEKIKESPEQGQEQLRSAVASLFDTIIEQQALKLGRMKERLAKVRARSDDAKADHKQTAKKGEKRGRRRRVRSGERVKDYEKALQVWRENREQIIELKYQEMQRGAKPFPWGR